jgi:hypothetical protein
MAAGEATAGAATEDRQKGMSAALAFTGIPMVRITSIAPARGHDADAWPFLLLFPGPLPPPEQIGQRQDSALAAAA